VAHRACGAMNAELRKMRTAGRRTIEFEQATKQSLLNSALKFKNINKGYLSYGI